MAKVYLSYDGWRVEVGGKTYAWDHNDETLGTDALMAMLYDLGYSPEFREEY